MTRTMYMTLIAALAAIVPASGQQSRSVQVRTPKGILEGAVSADGVRSFKGVPFAAPPVGSLRWQIPHPVPAWSGVKKTTEFAPRCRAERSLGELEVRLLGCCARPGADPGAEECAALAYGALKPEGRKLSELMGDYWTTFAKTGDPNGKGPGGRSIGPKTATRLCA